MAALDDLRVLDLSGQVAGPFCAKLLADFGADVIKVEPPGGEAGRRLAPLMPEALTPQPPRPMLGEGVPRQAVVESAIVGASQASEQEPTSRLGTPSPSIGRGGWGVRANHLSAFFLYLNTSKRSMTLDITTSTGAAIFGRLVQAADVVIESFPPGFLDALGLGFEALESLRPGIILTSITPFGQTGPWRDLPANDLVAYACSGWASVNGWPDREPLKGSGYQASFQAGLAAFNATMAAVVHRDRSRGRSPRPEGVGEGEPPARQNPRWGGVGPHGVPNSNSGQHVDVSILEPSVASFAPALLTAQYRGEPQTRQRGDFQRGPVPAADGYFSLTLSRAHFWRDAMNELGLPELAHDERWYESSYRQEHHGDVAELVQSRIATRSKRELFDALGALRVVGGMVLTTEELFADPHVRDREFLTTVEHSETGPLEYPGMPFRMSATPGAIRRPAPQLGEHTAEVLREAGVTGEDLARLRVARVV